MGYSLTRVSQISGPCIQTFFLLPEWKVPGNPLTGRVQPMVPPVREFPGNSLTGEA